MSDLGYVRTEMLGQKPPPSSSVGLLGWVRANLFPSVLNSVLTVLSAFFIFFVIEKIVSWAWAPTWGAKSLTECRDMLTGMGLSSELACWGVIRDRWLQILMGFYPTEAYWRPILAFFLLFVALAPVLFADKVSRKLLLVTAVYPFLMPWLIWGGTIWSPLAAALGFVIFWAINRYTADLIGAIGAFILAVLGALLWWIVLSGIVTAPLAELIPVGFTSVDSRDLGGMLLSITIGVVAIAVSLPLGILLALGRRSDLFIVKTLCVGFIEFIRGVPLITLLFVASTLLNYFLPPGTSFDIVLRVIIMATLFSSAYMAEVIRGGLAALPKGQYEGADSLGLDYWQSQRLIIMPQALKISIPGIVSTFIGLFKDTTLVSIIGLFDPLGLARSIVASTDWSGIVWELYSFIAVLFWVFCFSMSRYSMYLERKLNKDHR